MIYLIITTSIENKFGVQNNEDRKNKYMNSIARTLAMLPQGIKPIIVENNGKRETYLDSFGIDVFYTDNNKKSYFHKGVNEMNDIHDAIKHYKIQDNDMVIKITGRYFVNNKLFFTYVLANQTRYNSFLKFFNVCTLKYEPMDCVLGLFALRCKYLQNFNYMDFSLSAEVEFAKYIRQIGNTCEIRNLFLTCQFSDDLRILNV